jgi:hypothetical protein
MVFNPEDRTGTSIEKQQNNDRKILTKMLEVLGSEYSEELAQEVFGISAKRLANLAKPILVKLERLLAEEVKESYNPEIEDHNAERGLYKVDIASNTEDPVSLTYGSVYSLVDITDEAEKNRKEAELLGIRGLRSIVSMNSEQNMPWGLGLKQLPGNSLDAVLTLGGSNNDQRVRLTAGDRDYGSYATIEAKRLESAAELLAGCVRTTLHSVDLSPRYQFLEVKLGVDPDDETKSIKWDGIRILRNDAPYGDPDNLKKMTLEKASQNPGKIKFDYFAKDVRDRLVEVTMVVLPRFVIPENPEVFIDMHTNSYSPFGEIFFDDPDELQVFNSIHDPLVMAQWRRLQIDQAKHYLSEDDFNPLKAIKRIYTTLKLDGRIDDSHRVASYFGLPEAQLYRMMSELETLAKYIKQPVRKWQPATVAGAIGQLIDAIDPDPSAEFGKVSKDQNKYWRERMLSITRDVAPDIVALLLKAQTNLVIGSIGEGQNPAFKTAHEQLTEVVSLLKQLISKQAQSFVTNSKDVQSLLQSK